MREHYIDNIEDMYFLLNLKLRHLEMDFFKSQGGERGKRS